MSTPHIETINGIEICQTMGNNPDDPPEQHATGKPTVWWRFSSEWIVVDLPIEQVRERCGDCGRSFQKLYMELWNSSHVKESLTTETKGQQ